VLRARKAVPSAVHFFDFAAFRELPNHAGQESASVVLQPHTVRDFAKAVRLGKRGQIGENFARFDFAAVTVPVRMRVFALQGNLPFVLFRLTDFRLRGKARIEKSAA
jgi:hypothetical protein